MTGITSLENCPFHCIRESKLFLFIEMASIVPFLFSIHNANNYLNFVCINITSAFFTIFVSLFIISIQGLLTELYSSWKLDRWTDSPTPIVVSPIRNWQLILAANLRNLSINAYCKFADVWPPCFSYMN